MDICVFCKHPLPENPSESIKLSCEERIHLECLERLKKIRIILQSRRDKRCARAIGHRFGVPYHRRKLSSCPSCGKYLNRKDLVERPKEFRRMRYDLDNPTERTPSPDESLISLSDSDN